MLLKKVKNILKNIILMNRENKFSSYEKIWQKVLVLNILILFFTKILTIIDKNGKNM